MGRKMLTEIRPTTGGLAIWRGDEYILNFFQDESVRYWAFVPADE